MENGARICTVLGLHRGTVLYRIWPGWRCEAAQPADCMNIPCEPMCACTVRAHFIVWKLIPAHAPRGGNGPAAAAPSPRLDTPRARMQSSATMLPFRILVALVALVLAAAAAGVRAADADPAGRSIAASCAGCHGTNGVSAGGVPSLAGVPKAELAAKLGEYKAGRREGTIMPQLAKGYTDDQIDRAAAWFAAQPAPRK